jgi:hypothetical protein
MAATGASRKKQDGRASALPFCLLFVRSTMIGKMKFLLLTIFVSVAAILRAQIATDTETHGTINVLLSNRNGAVIVTDSKISSVGGPVGYSQKLFILNNHAACAIAGYYDSPGAQLEDPSAKLSIDRLNLSVPNIINDFIKNTETSNISAAPVAKQLEELSEIYTFVMELAANLTGSPYGSMPSKAVITLVGYEGKSLRLAGVSLVPYRIGRVWMFFATDKIGRDLTETPFDRVEGVPYVEENVKKDPVRFKTAPLLKDFAKFLDDGRATTIEELKQIAQDLEIETATQYPSFVGGERQTATFIDGKVKYTGPAWSAPDTYSRQGLTIDYRYTAFGNTVNPTVYSKGSKKAIIYIDANIGHSVQLLDGIAFVRSDIDNSSLRYNGTKPTSLGSSNRITNSQLIVGKAVSKDDPFLKKVKADFPDLKLSYEQ